LKRSFTTPMRNTYKTILVLTLLLISTVAALGQKTRDYTDAITHFEYGKMLYIKMQYVPAIEEFETFLKQNPGPNFAYESKAYIALSRLKLEKQNASRDLAQFLRDEPEHKLNTEITYELGIYYFNEGKYTRTLKYLDEIEEADVSKEMREELAFKKGYSYFKNDEHEAAKNEFRKIIYGNGKYAIEANYYYGYQCYVLKDYACAISTFTKIGDNGPKTMQLYLAQIYYEQKEYEKAYEIVKKINLTKQQDEVELLTGKIQYQLGNKSLALSHFDKYTGEVKKLQPDEIYQIANANYEAKQYKKSTEYYILIANENNAIGQSANYHLGILDVNTGEKVRALNAFGEAKRKDFDKKISEVSAFNYAKLAAELQQNSTAINSIKSFLDDYPKSEYRNEAKSLMADIFLSTKNYKSAIEVLEDIDELNNDTKMAYQELTFHRGEELYLNKEYQNADIFFKKSLKYPKEAQLEALAYFWRAEIAYKVDDYDESLNLLNRFMSNSGASKSKNKTYAYYSMGYNYFKKKDYPKAQNYFYKFKQNETYNELNKVIYLDNTQRLADCYFLNRQYNAAIEEYSFIIKNNYKNADYAIFQQGMLYGLQDRHSEKINVLKRLQNDFSKSIFYDDALYQIGREYLLLGNYSTAESIFNLIISQHDYSPYLADSYLKLGLINYNQSKDDAALRYYKTVVERFPKTTASQEALSFIEIIYTSQGTPEEYFKWADKMGAGVRLSYQDSVIYNKAMDTYNAANYTGASKELGAYLAKFGEKGFFVLPANYYKAEADYYTNNENQALKHYDYVVASDNNPFKERALIKLSATFYYRKDFTKALDYYVSLEPLASSKSTFIGSILGQMRCNYSLSNFENAKQKAVQLLPIENVPKEDLVEANMVLGRIQIKDNNLRTAKFHFDYVIAESRNELTAEALYNRAFILYEQSDFESSRKDIYKLNNDYSAYEFWVVKGFIILSDIYVKEKDYFQAKATIQSILDNYTNKEDGVLKLCQDKIKVIEKKQNPKLAPTLEPE
jgi:tetratricopeptide (TPR) repeat protein